MPAPLEMREVFPERGPRDVEAEIALPREQLALHLAGERAHRGALAEHFERDALAQIALGIGVGEQGFAGPRQRVDEARRDGETAGIESLSGATRAQVADGGDAIRSDADVGNDRRGAATVVDGAAANQQVEACVRRYLTVRFRSTYARCTKTVGVMKPLP